MRSFCLILLSLFVAFPGAVAAEDRTFDVGMVLPLTGKLADYGEAIQNSIELARRDSPDRFTNVRFHYEDAGYDPKLAVVGFNALVDVRKVDLAVTWGVAFCKTLAPIAEFRRIPLVGICIDPTTAAGRRHVLRFMNVTDEFMAATSKYLHARNRVKLALLLTDDPYLEELSEALQRNLQPGQTLTVVERFPTTEMDFRTRIIKLRRAGFDAIGVFLSAGQISSFYKQARQMDFELETFGTNFFESLSELRAGEETMDGAAFANVAVKTSFQERYKAIFGNDSQLAFGAPAYEFAATIGELFNHRAGQLTNEEVLTAFSKVEFREGSAAGPYSYVDDEKVGRYFRFPIAMKVVRGESFSLAK